MVNEIRIMVLYKELSQYFLDCVTELSTQLNASVSIIADDLKEEAPFNLVHPEHFTIISRSSMTAASIRALIADQKPVMLFVGGWSDGDYLKAIEGQNETVKVLGFDNQWQWTIRKVIGAGYLRVKLASLFDYAFVPGLLQKRFAQKLGFSNEHIELGAYAANTDHFSKFYRKGVTKENRFLFLGRYVKHKGIFDLWKAFEDYRKEGGTWELWCVGTGDQFENRVISDGITHLGFIQPAEMAPIIKACSVYILPSHFEPWGVSVHEMAAAGFPLILSDQIGSKEMFLHEGANGFQFKSGNTEELKLAMHRMSALTDQALADMSAKSHELGMSHTPEIWSKTLISLINK